MPYISRLNLSDFRCYAHTRLDSIGNGLIVLHGANGAGKTNVLEAISLLSPGRGLRNAKTLDVQRHIDTCADTLEKTAPWAVSARLETSFAPVNIGTGLDPATVNTKPKRIIRINGETERSQSALAEYLNCIWLTPQMDGLFMGSSGERRRFFDRFIYAFDKGHAGRLTRYQNALSQRSKLLKEQRGEPVWLDGLEAQIAETGVAIAAARVEFNERLSDAHQKTLDKNAVFPQAKMRMKGTLENLLSQTTALDVETIFKQQLYDSRGVDMLTGGAATGIHKSDLDVFYTQKNRAANQCSTGEQKALLIGIILAYAQLVNAESVGTPILLLDEVGAHLDEGRRAQLYEILRSIGGQVWLTGADTALFSSLRHTKDTAQFFEVKDKTIIQS